MPLHLGKILAALFLSALAIFFVWHYDQTAGIVRGQARQDGISATAIQFWIYVAQIFSGNWTIDQHDKLSTSIVIGGTLIAILLNAATVIGAVVAGLSIFRANRSNAMEQMKAIDLLAIDQMTSLLDLLDPEVATIVASKMPEATVIGKRKWASQTLPSYLGANEAHKFLAKLEKTEQATDDKPQRDSASTHSGKSRYNDPKPG